MFKRRPGMEMLSEPLDQMVPYGVLGLGYAETYVTKVNDSDYWTVVGGLKFVF